MTAKRRRAPRRKVASSLPDRRTARIVQALEVQREENRPQAERWLDLSARLEDTLDQYVLLFEEAPVGYLTIDAKGLIVEINAAAAAILGADRERLKGKPFLGYVFRPDAKMFLTHLAKAATGTAATELRMRGSGSGPRPARIVSRRAVVPHPRHARYYTILTDVTEQRQSEQALLVSEKRHREIVETSNEGICIVNERNEIVFANRRFANMVGTTADDLLGRSAFELVCDEDLPSARSAFDQRGISSELADERLRRIDGTLLPAMVSTTIMRDDQGRFTGTLRMYTDATARQELVAAREMLVRQLVAAQERERQRIARELHDQTGQHIVALTLGLARLASTVVEVPSAAPLIEQLRSVADSLGRDVHTLAMELRPSALDHLGLAPALTAYADAVAARAGLDIDVHCDPIDDLQLSPAAQTGLYRVAQEALTNVVKHARAQHASVILERRGDALQLIVEDDGIGFVDTLNRNAPKLGLLGMRERAALLGGTVTIESSPGKGTTVYARIPLVTAATESDEHEQETSPAAR